VVVVVVGVGVAVVVAVGVGVAMNYYATYALTIRPTEVGQFYAVLLERDTNRLLWESRFYEDSDDAWCAGWEEWRRRARDDENEAEAGTERDVI
jgi:hypothetical protein